MATIKVAYCDKDGAKPLKTQLTLPKKWLKPEINTACGRVLDVFVKTYNARVVGGKLDASTLVLVNPATLATHARTDALLDALAGGHSFEVKGLGANFAGEFFPTEDPPVEDLPGQGPKRRARRGQDDQPTCEEHERRPDCVVGVFEVNFSGTMYNGVGYVMGPGSTRKISTPPPIARHGLRFKGLLDPLVHGYVRVLHEVGGFYDGLWLPRVSAGHECIKRMPEGTELCTELAPPRPRTPPVKGPLAPEVKAAWDAYFKECETKGTDDDPEVIRWRRKHGIPDPNSEEGRKARESEVKYDHPLFGGKGGAGLGGGVAYGGRGGGGGGERRRQGLDRLRRRRRLRQRRQPPRVTGFAA
ncbi:hypothetical protein JL720_678 [Aureococcus anophagefferens]|nr:hypothetical protein JL720_678 [Aureococcus anophagefferens]